MSGLEGYILLAQLWSLIFSETDSALAVVLSIILITDKASPADLLDIIVPSIKEHL